MTLFAGMLLTVWIVVVLQITTTYKAMIADGAQEARHLAKAIERRLDRVAVEIDNVLVHTIVAQARSRQQVNWPQLLEEGAALAHNFSRMAAIAASGSLIAEGKAHGRAAPSESCSRYTTPKGHGNSRTDGLFVSPLISVGEGSPWCVYFARPFFTEGEQPWGFVVAAISADKLSHIAKDVHAGRHIDVAIADRGNVIRAGTGPFAGALGQRSESIDLERVGTLERPALWQLRAAIAGERPDLEIVSRGALNSLNVVLRVGGGSAYAAWVTNRIVYLLSGFVLTAMIVSAAAWTMLGNRRPQAWMRRLTNNDLLPPPANRLLYFDSLKSLTKGQAATGSFAVHRIDLDRFRLINDRYGYEVGDTVLSEIGKRLLDVAGPKDVVGRTAGDEFLIIQNEVTKDDDVLGLALRLRDACRQQIKADWLLLDASCSIGSVARADRLGAPDQIMRCAALALNAAKASGSDCVRLFEQSMLDEDLEAERIEVGLKRALASDGLDVHYQPIVSASGRAINSVEALVRWTDTELGVVSPAKFIPIAERSGLIIAIGCYVLRRACRDIATVADDDLSVAVNISAIEFRKSDVVEAVRNALAESGLEPRRLTIEVTESVILDNTDNDRSQLAKLRNMGVRLSLDDFGTGYSSLSYLHTFALDCIKIDQSFVRRVLSDNRSQAIVKAIIDISRGLNVSTVAEGVESEQEAHLLSQFGATNLQGYFFSKPLPLQRLLQCIESARACRETPPTALVLRH